MRLGKPRRKKLDSQGLVQANRVVEVLLADAVDQQVPLSDQYDLLGLDGEAFDRFLGDNMRDMHKLLPKLDPRMDGTINVFMRHMFLVGYVAGYGQKETS